MPGEPATVGHDGALALLWPAGVPSPGDEADPARATYLAYPNPTSPRFVLPAGRRDALAVLRHFRTVGDPAARRRLAVLRAVIAATGGRPLGRRYRPVIAGSIEEHLRDVLGQQVRLGVHLGPPRPNRKPVLQVLDSEHRPLAFGKLGASSLTDRLVQAEITALRRLDGARLPGVEVPSLVHDGRFGDRALLLTTVLRLDGVAEVPGDRREQAMVAVARSLGVRAEAPAGSAWLTRLRSRAAAVEGSSLRERLLGALAVLSADDAAWETGCWHGDWTRWNTGFASDRVLVWDWERFEEGVPLGWDALHDRLRSALEHRAPTEQDARNLVTEAPRLLGAFGVPRDRAARVAQSYLVELAVRYAADRGKGTAGRSARVEDWLLSTLPVSAGDAP